jgi:hypothetical protein
VETPAITARIFPTLGTVGFTSASPPLDWPLAIINENDRIIENSSGLA